MVWCYLFRPLQVSRGLGFASRKLREEQCVAAQRVHVVGIGSKGALIVVLRRRNVALASQFGGQGQTSLSLRWRHESREAGDRRPNRGGRNR